MCGRCQKTLPRAEFSPSQLERRGAWCRNCQRQRWHERKTESRDAHRCVVCEKSLAGRHFNTKFCSPTCRRSLSSSERQTCAHCRESFDSEAFSPSRRGIRGSWCRNCINEHKRRGKTPQRRPARQCLVCGDIPPTADTLFCSLGCSAEGASLRHKCGRCQQELDPSAFSRSQFDRDGSWCKTCNNQYRRDRRAGLISKQGVLNCLVCGTSIRDRRSNARYCSPACHGKGWRAANPGRQRQLFVRSTYGLEPDQYDAMVITQAGRCAICLRLFGEDVKICIDHDHSDGRVRGLLCSDCNSGLGYFRDDSEALLRATTYLAS